MWRLVSQKIIRGEVTYHEPIKVQNQSFLLQEVSFLRSQVYIKYVPTRSVAPGCALKTYEVDEEAIGSCYSIIQ